MGNQGRIRVYCSVLLLLALGWCLIVPCPSGAQPRTHTVKDGDTLWSISEMYYGVPDLWPKLWEINPFVTNPHFLKEGDVIRLLEDEPTKEIDTPQMEIRKEVKPAVETALELAPEIVGIDVSSFINVKASGYLSREKVKPWGRIFAVDGHRFVLAADDKVFVEFSDKQAVKLGDLFTVFVHSAKLRHPLTKKILGYAVRVHGFLVIEERIEEGIYKARIVETVTEVLLGDMLIPFDALSPCVKPVPTVEGLTGLIVATQDEKIILGHGSVVYLDIGFKDGVRRGNIFDVLKQRETLDPKHKIRTGQDYIIKPKIALPDLVLGRILILDSKPDTSTGLVLYSTDDFGPGAPVKGLISFEGLEFLPTIPPCSVE